MNLTETAVLRQLLHGAQSALAFGEIKARAKAQKAYRRGVRDGRAHAFMLFLTGLFTGIAFVAGALAIRAVL